MRFVWGLLFLAYPAQAALKDFRCLAAFPALLAVSNPDVLHLKYPVRPIALVADMWAGAKPAAFASRYHPPETPRSDGYLPKSFGPRDFEIMARRLAADHLDARSLTYQSPLGDGTQIKLHLATGELLIANAKGELSCFVKLPVGERSVAGDFNTAQIFSRLTGIVTAPQKYGTPPERYAQLTAGESVRFGGFPGDNHLTAHVDKHVLGILNNFGLGAGDRARVARIGGGYATEFLEMRQLFMGNIRAAQGDPVLEEKAYADLKAAYSKRAETFMQSNRPSILTITRADRRMVDGKEKTQLLGYRFDTLTNELAIFDRQTGRVITYFRVEMAPANAWLEKVGYPPVNTPMEYFLSVAKVPQPQ